MKPLPVLINKLDDVHRLVERIYEHGNRYTYDFETLGNRPSRLRVAGLGLAYGFKPGQGSYIVTEHDNFLSLSWDKVLDIVRPLFTDSSMTAIAHNQLFDATILDRYGIRMHTNTYDTMVMNWLLNTETTNGLKDIIKRIYGHQMTELSQFCGTREVEWHPGKILSLDQSPIETLSEYAVEDVLWTFRLAIDEITAIKQDKNLNIIYHDLYRRYLRVLTEMESDGIQVNRTGLEAMEVAAREMLNDLVIQLLDMRQGSDFDPSLMTNTNVMIKSMGLKKFLAAPKEMREAVINQDRKLIPELQIKWKDRKNLREELYDNPHRAHKLYNLNSNDQLNTLLFEELNLTPVGELSKMGLYSVDAKTLIKLQVEDSSGYVTKMLEYRRLHKLHSQYMVGLLPLLDDDNRLRTSFNPALKTGRLSSRQPNLQNIVHDDKFPIRSVFVARPGKKLIVLDYSQMELRILAHYSQDPAMIDGFIQGFDPHSNTALRVFNLDCPIEEIPEKYNKYRKISKTLNFGTVYGVGAASLVEQIADATKGEMIPSVKQAQGYINKLFEEFPGVLQYITGAKSRAQREGLVRTLIGRPRHLPDAQQSDDMRAFYGALRRAANTPIQGTAADIIAIAMCNISEELEEMGYWRTKVILCLQVHDELIFEVDDDVVEEVKPILEREMINAVKLKVPLHATGGVGMSWTEAK